MSEHQKRQMLLSEVPVNPSVEPEDELRLSAQALDIYKRLKHKAMWTADLILPDGVICPLCGFCSSLSPETHINCQYNARLNEIRHALMEMGLTVDLTEECASGNNKYEIVNFEGSRFQAHLKETGTLYLW